jgi:hypothetical protein
MFCFNFANYIFVFYLFFQTMFPLPSLIRLIGLSNPWFSPYKSVKRGFTGLGSLHRDQSRCASGWCGTSHVYLRQSGRNRSWHNLRYHPSIFREEPRSTTKASVRTLCIQTDIWIWTSQIRTWSANHSTATFGLFGLFCCQWESVSSHPPPSSENGPWIFCQKQ